MRLANTQVGLWIAFQIGKRYQVTCWVLVPRCRSQTPIRRWTLVACPSDLAVQALLRRRWLNATLAIHTLSNLLNRWLGNRRQNSPAYRLRTRPFWRFPRRSTIPVILLLLHLHLFFNSSYFDLESLYVHVFGLDLGLASPNHLFQNFNFLLQLSLSFLGVLRS